MTRYEFRDFMNKPVSSKKIVRALILAAMALMLVGIGISCYILIYNADFEIKSYYGPFNISATPAEHFKTEELKDGSLKIVSYLGDFETVVIPHEIGGKKVTEIERFALISDNTIKNVYIPQTVREIGNMALYNCKNLEMIYIPKSVDMIGGWAFSGSSENFFIYSEKGSFVEEYANAKGINFKAVS